jgi:Tfp pilus assembly protein PilV
MDIETLIILIALLMLSLGILALVFVVYRYKAAQPKDDHKEEILTMEQMIEIVKNPSSKASDLEKVVSNTLRNFIKISQSEYKSYDQLIVGLCSHKVVNKDMVLKLDRALAKNNPALKSKLEATLKKALNSRA